MSGTQVGATSVGVHPRWIQTFQSRGMWTRKVMQTEQRYKIDRQRHRIEQGGQSSEYWIQSRFSRMLMHPNPKSGGKRKRLFSHDTKNKQQIRLQYLKHLFPELSILLFRQDVQQPHLRPSILWAATPVISLNEQVKAWNLTFGEGEQIHLCGPSKYQNTK